MMTIMEKHDKAIIDAVDRLPDTFTWKMLSKKLNVLGHWISPKTVRKRLTNGVVDLERIDIGLYRKGSKKYCEVQLESPETLTLEAIAEKTKRPLTISEIENTEHYKALKHKNKVLQFVVDEFKKDLVNVGKLQWNLKEENKALEAKVEELEATIEENVDNSYRWNDKVKRLEDENERLIKEKTELQESIKSMDKSVRKHNAELVCECLDLKDENEALKKYKEFHDGIQEIAKKYTNETKKERFFRILKDRNTQIAFWSGWLINTILTLILSEVLK